MDIQKLTKALGGTALVALSAVSLAACGVPPGPEQRATASAAGLGNATLYPNRCEVWAHVDGLNTTYNFKYGAVFITTGMAESTAGYSISFNDIAVPATQRQIQQAYDLLPASANCTAPIFANSAS